MQASNIWKFSPPHLHNVLHRQKLANLLKSRPERKIILIHAKAGQGKTTFMADFLKSGSYPSIWIRLTADDRNPEIFLEKLLEAVAALNKNNPEPRSEERDEDSQFDAIIGGLHSAGRKNLHIVLDDFHMISGSAPDCSIVERLIDSLPDSVKLVILSRKLPCLSLARARLLQNLIEIRDNDLALSDDEAVELLRDVYPLDISEKAAGDVNRRTDGWVTGIIFLIEQMSLLESGEKEQKLIEKFLSGEIHPDFIAFFEDEVLRFINPSVKNALVLMSPFSDFPGELAEKILGREAGSILSEAAGGGLFLSRSESDSSQWIFNPIFSDYLSTLFDKLSEIEQKAVLESAADFFSTTGDKDRALLSLIRIGAFNQAEKIFLEYAEFLIRTNKHLRIRKLLAMFPREMQSDNQYLVFYGLISDNLYHPHVTKKKLLGLLPFFMERKDADRQATIYSVLLQNYFFYQENRENVGSIAGMAADFLKQPHNNLHPDKRRLLEALLPLGEGWITPADDEVFDAAMRAEETSLRLHDNDAFLCSRLVLARKYIHRGDFQTARSLLNKTLEFFTGDRKGRPYLSLISFYLGDILLYTGDIHSAIRLVQDGLDDATPDFAFRPYLELNLILYHLYLLKFQNAESLFAAIDDQKMGDNLYLRYYRVYFLQMLIAYRNENRRRTAYYCKRLLEPENEALLNTDYPYSLIALLEVCIWLEEEEMIEALVLRLDEEIIPDLYPYPAATYYALRALYHHRKDETREAAGMVEKSQKILRINNFSNLDICNPEVLFDISRLFDGEPSELFPRLKPLVATNQFREKQARLEIRTLGEFRIFTDGKEIPINRMISQKRVMDLLKLLIIFRKNGVVKEMVYEPFWPKYSLKNARDNLNTIFYRLRNILGKDNDFFIANSTTISFREDVLDTDVDRFLEFISLGEDSERRGEIGEAIDMFSHAVDTYGGDFLLGDLYSDFIRDERHLLQRKYVNTLFHLSKLYLSAGDYLQALNNLKALLEIDPVCEPAVRLLMIGSALVGSRNSIPQIFDELRVKLMDSFSLEPDEITLRLKDTLLSGKRAEASMWENEVVV